MSFRALPILAATAAVGLAGCDSHAAPASGPGIVAEGERFACTPEKVWDGDGPIHCAEGPKVRLAGIAAREMDGTCKAGHPCPDATAEAARDALAALLGRTRGSAPAGHVIVEGPPLECLSEGSAKGSRTAAWCISPIAGDLSCAMLATGTAAKWDRYWRGHRCG